MKNELKMNQNNANFPQGYQNCQKHIQNQIEKNDFLKTQIQELKSDIQSTFNDSSHPNIESIQNQIEKNDKIFVYKGRVNVQAKKPDVYYYDECLFLKTAIYVIFLISNSELDSILKDIDKGYNFIQGKSFAKNLVLERERNGEAIHYVHAGGGRYSY